MHILVAIDRSEESRNALTTAFDIQESADGRVTAVHAVESSTARTNTAKESTEDAKHGEEILEEAEAQASKRDLSIETELLVGDPVETITEYAEENAVDVIYAGHRGLANKGEEVPEDDRGPLGSVAKGVVERTKIPVSVFDKEL